MTKLVLGFVIACYWPATVWAFNSVEALQRKGDHSVQQVVAWLETGNFLWPVEVGDTWAS